MPHEFVRPFHFWCQKVLPLVFDDSLSYYEVLAKMRDYLNNAIAEINAIGGEFGEVKNQLTQLQTYVDEYFAELDVNQAISDKLDGMVESGEMDAVITPIFAAYANPLFAASVADMIATNFAYANYENNKIYTFNQSTGLYQTTGKEFGGVVSSVDEMEDNDKYYALDSDGMLYSYDFPQSAFVATGLTYGGYRYGVNAMRPIANTYVLTTDSHIYTWNGSEYVDSGVVYGLSNTAFIWRRKLTNNDTITQLIIDGWYSIDKNDLPLGLPVNMNIDDGFAVVYTIPNVTTNGEYLYTASNETVQTQNNSDIKADSRNKRVILNTNNGGSWFWDGNEWVNNSLVGYRKCANCNNVNWNSVLLCDSETQNSPETDGTLSTFFNENLCVQLFVNGNGMWFRYNYAEWVKVTESETSEKQQDEINYLLNYSHVMFGSLLQTVSETQTELKTQNNNLQQITAITTMKTPTQLVTNANDELTAENANGLMATTLQQRVDSTLTQPGVAADAQKTGIEIRETQAKAFGNANKLAIEEAKREQGDNAIYEYIDTLIKNVYALSNVNLLNERSDNLATEDENQITGTWYTTKTDKTLSEENVAADAKAVGEAIDNCYATIQDKDNSTKNEINKAKKEVTDYVIDTYVNKNEIGQMTAAEISVINSGLSSENGDMLMACVYQMRMDETLTSDSLPALSSAVGNAIDELSREITRTNNELSITTQRTQIIENALTYYDTQITTNSGLIIATESDRKITTPKLSVKCDSTLTQTNMPADSKAVGDKFNELAWNYKPYLTTFPTFTSYTMPTINFIGNMPTTKTKVNLEYEIVINNIVIRGECKMKIQGNSSTLNPKKNFNVTFDKSISMFGYSLKKWNLKSNYNDNAQVTNLVCARAWNRTLHEILPTTYTVDVFQFICENGNTIEAKITYAEAILNAPHGGATDGHFCCIANNGEFFGLYTCQIPKSTEMFGAENNDDFFLVSSEHWNVRPFTSMDDFHYAVEIEEQGDNVTESDIYNALSSLADICQLQDNNEFIYSISQLTNPNITMAYMAHVLFTQNTDGTVRNWLMYSYDKGKTINISAWDMDGCLGNVTGGFAYPVSGHYGRINGYGFIGEEWGTVQLSALRASYLKENILFKKMLGAYRTQFKEMYFHLRESSLSTELVHYDFTNMLSYCQSKLLEMDNSKWPTKPNTLGRTPAMAILSTMLNAQIDDNYVNGL